MNSYEIWKIWRHNIKDYEDYETNEIRFKQLKITICVCVVAETKKTITQNYPLFYFYFILWFSRNPTK
jgi:hypothetical protein